MNWDDLKIALAVGRAGSLTRAAQLLGIDQSTAGRRLTALEAELGTILFARSKTGFAPTEAGDAVIARATEMELRADRLVEDLARSEEPSGIVRLVGNPWTLERLTRLALPSFMALHPALCIRTVGYVQRGPAHGEATLSLWFEMPPRGIEFAIKLGEVPYAVYAARDRDPEGLGWASFFDDETPRSAPLRALERLRQKGEPIRFTGTDAGAVLSAVRAGLGRGLLPMCMAEDDPQLIRVGDGPPEMVETLHLHAHPDTVQAKRIQATIRWLRECFASVFAARSL